MPRPHGLVGGHHNTPTTGAGTRSTNPTPAFMFDFGSLGGSHGNQEHNENQRASASSGSATTPTPSAPHVTTSGGDGVRIVMDDIVALFSNAGHPVTSHSETSQTSTATPSQRHSQGDTQTQTQNSGTTGTSRVIPRIGLGSLPLNSNHQDPLVPCESFHFGPRAHQAQGAQTRDSTQGAQTRDSTQGSQARDSTQEGQNQGFAQSFSDMIASVIGARPGQTAPQGIYIYKFNK
jgi:hypothetical protein